MAKRRKKKRKGFLMKHWKKGIGLLVGLVIILFAGRVMKKDAEPTTSEKVVLSESEITSGQPEFTVDLLTVNPYSRVGTEVEKIDGIVIHYTANPGTTAQNNRDYFESLKDTHETKASSHFIVGLDGEIIQCIPTWEMAYASNNRNSDTVSIECCHPDKNGRFTKETYQSLVQLTAWLCTKYDLSADDVIRHYDVTGKNCPKYFVEHEESWEEFKGYVQKAIEKE